MIKQYSHKSACATGPRPARKLCRLAVYYAALSLFAIALPLCAQDAKNKSNGAGNARELKAAQKPKSDKWAFSFLPVGLQRNPQVDFTIITEMTADGKKLSPPSFETPVYYISHSVGQHDVGDSYGGTKPIHYKYLEDQLNRALASNGYRLAGADHPATQVLFIAWGMHNRVVAAEDMDDGGGEGGGEGEGSDDAGDERHYVVDSEDIQNLLSRAKVVGGQKFADEFAGALSDQLDWTTNLRAKGPLSRFAGRDDLTETLVEQIFDDCYYLLVTSFEVEALKRNEKKILWTTKISTTARGISFEATIPNMIENGAYYFGREMTVPDIVRKRASKKGTVEIGEATVQEYYMPGAAIPSGTTSPSTSGSSAGKP